MRHHYRMTVTSGLAVIAVLCSACERSATAPSAAHRTTNITATATVPANPTAPVTIQTYDPQSQVSMTFDTTTQKLFAAAAGGAATLTLTDLAPQNFAQAPSGFRSVVSSADTIVGIYTITATAAVSGQVGTADRAYDTQPPATAVVWTLSSNTLPACGAYSVWVNVTTSANVSTGWLQAARDLNASGAGAAGSFALYLPAWVSDVKAIGVMIACSVTGLGG